LLALVLYVGCPHVQAHGRLATVDAAFTTLLLASFVALDHFRRRPGYGRLVLAALVFGLAALTKFTALLMLPVILALLVGVGLAMSPARPWRAIAIAASRFAAFGAVTLVIVNAGYAFRGTFQSIGAHQFESAFGQSVARTLPAELPLPLPRDFVAGLDQQKLDTERGEFGAYFAGRWYPRSPFLATLALLPLRLPLVTLGFLVWAVFRSVRKPGPWLDEAFVWLPPLVLVVALAAGSALSPALRYLLPALPFFHVAIARSVAHLGRRLRWATAAVLGLVTVATHPHQLAFFNVLAGGREAGHRWFIDSNLDWGQDLYRVRPWMQANGLAAVYLLYFGHVEPELYGIAYALPPSSPRPGTYVVSVNFAMGYSYVAPDHGRVVAARQGAPAWLRALTPVDRIGDSLWVYRVP
jgi:4-amino-4-deoxy-L-arabinose transferase-like glycosyltransferase